MADRVIAVHQPNLFPWLGFFQKIFLADCFVYLDHVEANPDQSWLKRVSILNQGKANWLSIPVKKGGSSDGRFSRIDKIQINKQAVFKEKQLRKIEYSYSSSPFFLEVFPLIKDYYDTSEVFLAKRNISFIEEVCRRMSLNTPRVSSASLDCQATSTDLVIEITKKVGGSCYLCGGGAAGYQEDSKFPEGGIHLRYQNFRHPVYLQRGKNEFISGLSILDALMECGFEKTMRLISEELVLSEV